MKQKDVAITSPQALPNFIAGNLRLLRKRQGWSQSELANRVDLNRGNIASYESGTAEPSICKLLRISMLFDVSTRDFTRRDFSRPGELEIARQVQNVNVHRERSEIAEFRDRALELSQLISSSSTLFQYQRKNIENACPEAAIVAGQYEQLYEFTQQLLQEHRALLTKVGCQCEQ